MVRRTLKFLIGLAAGIATFFYTEQSFPNSFLLKYDKLGIAPLLSSIVVFFIFYFVTGLILNKAPVLADKFDKYIRSKVTSMYEFVLGLIGSVCGLIIATLLSIPISRIPSVGIPVSIILNILFAYIGAVVLIRYKDDKIFLKIKEKYDDRIRDNSHVKIFDTSAIIDGRIYDIMSTGFMEGEFIVSDFVIEELKTLSDSQDSIKRNRGRRGLDVITKLQEEFQDKIRFVNYNKEVGDYNGVDDKLIHVAKMESIAIITNDINLNKVAKIQGVRVLNINELSNALKPIAVVGEDIIVTIVKGGKERDQGIGYLDGGTMVVVENSKKLVGETVMASVTSVIQTEAGRMVFADLKVS